MILNTCAHSRRHNSETPTILSIMVGDASRAERVKAFPETGLLVNRSMIRARSLLESKREIIKDLFVTCSLVVGLDYLSISQQSFL